MVRKLEDFHRCRFCGVICYSESEFGFEEKFKCTLCKYHWVVDTNSSILLKETFFVIHRNGSSFAESVKILNINFEKEETAQWDSMVFGFSPKTKFKPKPKPIVSKRTHFFESHKELKRYVEKFNIIS